MIFLSVVIPSYNETENIKAGALDNVFNYLSKQPYSWELIISDDGSPDKESLFLAQEFAKKHQNIKVLKNEHAGKPFAVRSGVYQARGEIILFTDMDQSTPIEETEKILLFYKENYDVVIGSRGSERKNYPLYRQIASVVFLGVRRAILLSEIRDTQCGFKSFKTPAIKRILNELTVFKKNTDGKGWTVGAWDVEMLFVAKKMGYKIAEVPVEWEDRDLTKGKGRSKNKFIKESKEMLMEILRVRWNDIKGKYNF